MADTRLSDLSAAGALSASDLFYVVQTPGSGGEKATGAQLLTLVGTTYVPLAGGTMTGALTIASGTLTASAPALSITQTWSEINTKFYALKVNVTDTNSLSSSLLADFQVAGVSKLYIRKDGALLTSSSGFFGGVSLGAGGDGVWNTTAFRIKSSSAIGWNSGTDTTTGAIDVALYRDAAATLALRNGTTAQRMHIYGTYTDSSNLERLTLSTTAGTSVNITAETLGTGGDNLDIVLTPAGTGVVKLYNGLTLLSGGISATGAGIVGSYFQTANAGAYVIGNDIGLSRNAAGVFEVNSTVAGTYRDLKLRNLLSTGYAQIDSGTLTASAPALSITQTWNNAGVSFESVVIDVTNTASSSPYFANFKVSGTSKWRVNHLGQVVSAASIVGTTSLDFYSSGLRIPSGSDVSWTSGAVSGTADLILARDAAATLAQRNGTNAQTLRVYRSYTDESNYSRLAATWNTTTALLMAEGLGTEKDGNVAFNDEALATGATRGYIMVPSAAGVSTGVPADIPTGQTPIVFDSTNKKIGAYTGGAWVWTAALS